MQSGLLYADLVTFNEGALLSVNRLHQRVAVACGEVALSELQCAQALGQANLATKFCGGCRLVEAPLKGSPLGDKFVCRVVGDARHANHQRLLQSSFSLLKLRADLETISTRSPRSTTPEN